MSALASNTSDFGTALRMERVSKRYPGTLAVDEVDLTVQVGEVHALLGENGAGKSTLMKMLAGSFADYTGKIFIGAQEARLNSPAAAKACGIGMVYQELSLAQPISIAENLLAGRLPLRWGGLLDRKRMMRQAVRSLAQVGLENLDAAKAVEEISQHEAQLVEIAKVLSSQPCILILDEPTSALSREEVERLFDIIRRLRNRGLAIIYISHHISEVFEIADRVTVMRDGRRVGTHDISEMTPESVVEMMIGGAVSDLYAERAADPQEPILRVEALSRYGFFHDVSFEARAGEILGLCGLSGAGRSELARSLCGIDPLDEGHFWLRDQELRFSNYSEAIEAGFAYLTEDRKFQGLAPRLTVSENLLAAVISRSSSLGFYRPSKGTATVQRLLTDLQVQPPDPDREMANLSGGNQQKVLLAKWLATQPDVLILDEPTRGVDVGAKALIHQAIAKLADQGKCILLISSDLPELVGLSDRVLVMWQGRIVREMSGPECTEQSVLLAANGEEGEDRP